LVLQVELAERPRGLVVDADEEEMVEDGADVARPVEEQLEEDLRHQKQACFDAEVKGKQLIVVVKEKEDLT
jgi:hypothetical protein